jgi:predicted transcriptional regulator
MPENLPTPAQIETKVRAAGMSMRNFCRQAGISQSGITRWKQGKFEPRLETFRRIETALANLPAATP